MKKNFLRIILSLFLVFSLISCSSHKTPLPNNEENVVKVSDDCKKIYNLKQIGLTSVKNAREAGGFLTKDGKKVKEKVLLRSAELSKLSDEEMTKLINEYNLKEVIDFRTLYEISTAPNRKIEGVNTNRIAILNENFADKMIESKADTYTLTGNAKIDLMVAYYKYVGSAEVLYKDIVNSEIANAGYRKFFDILLENDGTTLFHCTSGKDRTGFASIFLLSLLGVDRETVLNDFEASNVAYEEDMKNVEKLLRNVNFDEKELKEVIGIVGVDKDAAIRVLNAIDSEYGDIETYLIKKVGLTEEEINKLRDKFLE